MNRRSFLSASGSAMLVAHSPMLFATDGMSENPLIMGDEFRINSSLSQSKVTTDPGLSRRQWKTIIAVQDHLFPSEQDAPGAKEVNSQAYLYAVLSDANRDGRLLGPEFYGQWRRSAFLSNGNDGNGRCRHTSGQALWCC